MISAESFVETAREYGFRRYTGVPCSFITPFINYVINDRSLDYISSANEGDALATAAGSAIGGKPSIVMMQNSGLGNAVSPITSLSYTFRIPTLIITTHRGAAEVKDEPQHELMGKITGDLLDTMQVPWEFFPASEAEIRPALDRAMQYMAVEKRPYTFIMKKGTVAPYSLEKASIPTRSSKPERKVFVDPDIEPLTRSKALERIISFTPENKFVVITSTGFAGRELFSLNDRINHFYMVGSMGCASSFGLGLSLARSDLNVVVVDGDGAAMMRMGNFATLGTYASNNLIHILLDNGVYDSTGAQSTVSDDVAFADVAAACGYGSAYSGNSIDIINEIFTTTGTDGPCFAHLKTTAGTIENLPRPNVSPEEVLNRLMNTIGTQF